MMASNRAPHLSSQPEAYSRAFQRFLSLCDQEGAILKCIQGHIMPIITDYLPDLPKSGSPFRVLSVGSGEGQNDINILNALIELLSKQGEAAPSLANRVIEQEVARLNAFRSKAEAYMKDCMGRSRVDFEWLPMTFQEYAAKQKKEDDTMKMNLVHFIHSIYYVDVEEALVHCYEKELGTKGVILCINAMKENLLGKFKEAFPKECAVTVFPNEDTDVITVAREKGWKYFECPGDSNYLDIAAIFDGSLKSEGNELLNFMAGRIINVQQSEKKETVEKMLNFWKEESFLSEDGKRIVELRDFAVVILKGFEN